MGVGTACPVFFFLFFFPPFSFVCMCVQREREFISWGVFVLLGAEEEEEGGSSCHPMRRVCAPVNIVCKQVCFVAYRAS